MNPWIVQNLWLIPALPLLAAAVTSQMPKSSGKPAGLIAIAALGMSFLLAVCAFASALRHGHEHQIVNVPWFDLGSESYRIGWVLDPLAAVMLVMVTFVGCCIFIFSLGYMAHDPRRKQFFCFLSLFAAAMLGLLIANHLLVLFMCWELVGLASYLLIGFWFEKPAAAAACLKAFITTRVGDIGFLLGMLWIGRETGTLLFYDHGHGFLEADKLEALRMLAPLGGIGVMTAIGLLVFCGAAGKSGQFPLHVWLPDAMEGPTPVSALIHAATMVAAGVFLIARVYVLLTPGALQVIAITGAVTALFAAMVAVAQTDIKRILAYSTVSQLGYMMLALGVGGPAAAIFHLITHAFFKALLFLGSGSVIHGCHEEQDIRHMGGLRGSMKTTFATYAIGMMALSGFPLLFSGFWSKEGILHAAHNWPDSQFPFVAGVIGAGLTAFYMTRLMATVFFGKYRGDAHHPPHESPPVMTVPLIVLAVFAVFLGFVGTPAWPWFQGFLGGLEVEFKFSELGEGLWLMGLSTVVVGAGVLFGWNLYGRQPRGTAEQPDPIEDALPGLYYHLANRLWIDEFYEATVIRFANAGAVASDWMDRLVWGGCVWAVSKISLGFAWISRTYDEFGLNDGFDAVCNSLTGSGGELSSMNRGRVAGALRVIAIGFVLLALFTLVLMIQRATS
jgi:NADH-quinone oxidoreductase subunit L